MLRLGSYNLHDLGQGSCVGSVQYIPCPTPHIGGVGSRWSGSWYFGSANVCHIASFFLLHVACPRSVIILSEIWDKFRGHKVTHHHKHETVRIQYTSGIHRRRMKNEHSKLTRKAGYEKQSRHSLYKPKTPQNYCKKGTKQKGQIRGRAEDE